MLVQDRMFRDPVTVTPDDTLAHALQLTRRYGIRHLPVVYPNGGLAGIVSDRDIRLAMPSPLAVPDAQRAEFLERTPVAAIMTREVVTVTPRTTVEDAAKLLDRHRIGAVPVLGPDGRLEGILSETDLLHAFVQLLGGSEPSSRVEVRLADQPGELARAVQLLGQMRLNIVSLVVPSLPRQARKTAILHLSTIDPREALERLEAAGFEVGWPSLDADLRAESGERAG